MHVIGTFFLIVLLIVGGMWYLHEENAGNSGNSWPRMEWSSPSHPNAMEVLKERYARGEITREQYLAMRRDLEK